MSQLRENGNPAATSSAGEIHGSRRLGPLRPEQFQQALNRFDCGDFVSAEPIAHGLFGQNVFVTSSTGRFVLRGKPHFDWQFPKEQFFCDEIKRQTRVPVPHPYIIDPASDIFGWPYVLMPRMPGKFIHDPEIFKTIMPEDRLGIAAAMGETLAELHQCRFPQCGEYSRERNSIESLDRPYSQWILFHLRRTLDHCATLPEFSPAADLDWAWREIEAAAPALDVPFEPCAVMHDFKEGNATHEFIDGRWRVTGLFDLMEFYAGDGEADLGRQAADYIACDRRLASAFGRTYFARRPPRDGVLERLKIYLLADRLTIWDYGTQHGWFKPGETLRNSLQKFIATDTLLALL